MCSERSGNFTTSTDHKKTQALPSNYASGEKKLVAFFEQINDIHC